VQPSQGETPGIRIIPPLIYVAAMALAFLAGALWPIALLPDAIRYTVGPALIVASVAVMPPTLRAFKRAHTPFDVRRSAEALVTDGPYRYSRNPAYVAMIGLCLGIAVLADNFWAIPAVIAATAYLHRYVVLAEERHLEARFGDDYRRYKSLVRRWI